MDRRIYDACIYDIQMILLPFIYGAIMLLNLIHIPFSLLTSAIPYQIQDGFSLFLQYPMVFNGIFPVADLLLAGMFLLPIWAGIKTIELLFGLLSIFPGIRPRLPKDR